MTQASVARSPRTYSRGTARLQPPVPGRRLSAAVCGLGGRQAQRCPEQRPPTPRTPSPRASEVQPGGRVGTGVLGYTRPCGRESLAVTSGDKAPYGDGEGRRLATARGRLGVLAGKFSCARPGILHVQLLPLTRAYIQRRRESGVPRPAAAGPLRSLC